MKYERLMLSIVALCTFLITGLFTMNVYGEIHEKETKWSRMALMEVKKQFATSELSDFEHVQSVTISDEEAKEVYKVQVEPSNDRPFIVYIEITFTADSGHIRSIELKKKT